MVHVFLQFHLWHLLISHVRVDWTKIQIFVYFKKIKYHFLLHLYRQLYEHITRTLINYYYKHKIITTTGM